MTATVAAPGIRKAAVLLVQLGREKAGSVLAHMNEAEVEAVSAEIARLESLNSDEAGSVLTEFRELAMARAHIAQGGPAYALSLLEQSMGPQRAAEVMDRLTAASARMPFHFLRRADPRQLLSFISDEHPQVIALVLAHMNADSASLVLSGLSQERQADVAHRIAVMERTSPAIIRKVEASLERKLSSVLQPSELSAVGGIEPLVDIINRSDRATERLIMEWLEGRDAALAAELKSRMFMFDDIVSIDDRSMQQVLRQVEGGDLAVALKGVGEAVRGKVTTNMSERAATNLLEEVDLLGPVRLAQVEEAQQKIIQIIRTLEERGEIVVRRGNDDEFVD